MNEIKKDGTSCLMKYALGWYIYCFQDLKKLFSLEKKI